MTACAQCREGNPLTYAINPDPTEDEVRITDQNVLLIPARIDPAKLGLRHIGGANLNPEDHNQHPGIPLVWDRETCTVGTQCWPLPLIEDWDSTVQAEPTGCECDPTDPDGCCDETGSITYYREVNSDCLTHVCIGGELHAFCTGSTTPDPGTPSDLVCYDTTGFLPGTYGGGQGSWFIYNDNVLNEPCDPASNQFDITVKQFACWGDTGNNPGPPAGWNTSAGMPWDGPDPFESDPNVAAAMGSPSNSHGCDRPAFRLDPFFPVGTQGPATVTYDFTDVSGATRFAAYDKVSGSQLPVTILSQPAGSNAIIEAGTNGPQIFTNATAPGVYTFQYTPTGGMLMENVCFLVWNMGGLNSEVERVELTSITAFPNTTECCFSWATIEGLAAWMNANDTINPGGWFVDGDRVCTRVTPGLGSNYGDLSSCEGSITPTVVADTVGGGGSVVDTISGIMCSAASGVQYLVRYEEGPALTVDRAYVWDGTGWVFTATPPNDLAPCA